MTYLWITICVLSFILAVSLYYVYKFGVMLLRVQDSLEDALDILDERYASMSSILQIPIFYDSKEVRQVVSDVDECREAILGIARQLTVIDVEDDAALEEG